MDSGAECQAEKTETHLLGDTAVEPLARALLVCVDPRVPASADADSFTFGSGGGVAFFSRVGVDAAISPESAEASSEAAESLVCSVVLVLADTGLLAALASAGALVAGASVGAAILDACDAVGAFTGCEPGCEELVAITVVVAACSGVIVAAAGSLIGMNGSNGIPTGTPARIAGAAAVFGGILVGGMPKLLVLVPPKFPASPPPPRPPPPPWLPPEPPDPPEPEPPEPPTADPPPEPD